MFAAYPRQVVQLVRLRSSHFSTRRSARRSAESPELAAARLAAELAKLKSEKTIADAAASEAVHKAAATTRKVNAEADATTRKVNAEADAAVAAVEAVKMWRRLRSVVMSGVMAAVGLFFAFDELTHSKPWVRWRIKQTLKAGTDEALLPELPRVSLSMTPIAEEGSAVLVMGRSGSGKTTALGKMALELKQRGVPFVFIRMRSAHDRQQLAAGAESSGVDLSNAALRFYKAISFPEKPSWLSGWRMGGLEVSTGGIRIGAEREAQALRFVDAIRELFSVAADLRAERLQNPAIRPEDVTPVIIVDELHELLSEVALPAGGKRVFSQFGVEMATHCPDNHVKVFVAASGGYLVEELDAVAKITDPRATEFYSSDPTPASVRKRLMEVGFSVSDGDAILGTCGTRLRHLDPFLTAEKGAGNVMLLKSGALLDVGKMLERKLTAAVRELDTLFRRSPDPRARAALVTLLDKLAREEDAAEQMSAVEKLPLSAFTKPFPNKVLFLGPGGTVAFQSEPVRKVWLRERKKFAAA